MKGKSNSLVFTAICGTILSTTLAFAPPHVVLSQADSPRNRPVVLDTAVIIDTPPIVDRLAEKTKVLNEGVKSMSENSRVNEKKVDKLGKVVQQLKHTLASDEPPAIQPEPKYQAPDTTAKDDSVTPTEPTPKQQRKNLIQRIRSWFRRE